MDRDDIRLIPVKERATTLELSPDEDLILTGGDGAQLYSVSQDRVLWQNPKADLLDGAMGVNWADGTFCRGAAAVQRKEPNPWDENRREPRYIHRYCLFLHALETGKQLRRLPRKQPLPNINRTGACRYLPGGALVAALKQTLLTGEEYIHLNEFFYDRVVELDEGDGSRRRMRRFPLSTGPVLLLDSGDFLLLDRKKDQSTISRYGGPDWELTGRWTLAGHLGGEQLCPAPSGDALWLLGQGLSRFDLRTGALMRCLDTDATHLALSPDGGRVALGCAEGIEVRALPDGALLCTLPCTPCGPMRLGHSRLAAGVEVGYRAYALLTAPLH